MRRCHIYAEVAEGPSPEFTELMLLALLGACGGDPHNFEHARKDLIFMTLYVPVLYEFIYVESTSYLINMLQYMKRMTYI